MWTGINIKSTNRYYLESEENHKGNMRQKRQVVRPTKENKEVLQPAAERTTVNAPHKKHNVIYVKLAEMKNTINTNQTGKLLVTS